MDRGMELLLVIVAGALTFAGVNSECLSPNATCTNCTSSPDLTGGDSFPVNSYITWTCNDGFTLDGDADAIVWVCTEDGEWLGDEPNCTAIMCPSPQIPANGLIEQGTQKQFYSPGDIIQYACNANYYSNDTDLTSTCLLNSSWSNVEPYCSINCSNSQMSFPERNACFEVASDGRSWFDAKSNCEIEGGFLALVKDNETQHFLTTNLMSLNEQCWIGGKAGRSWKWRSDGRFIARLFWNDGEPGANEQCIEIREKDFQNDWNDETCTNFIGKGYICQFSSSECSGNSTDPQVHKVLYRKHCFHFFDNQSSWEDAAQSCEDKGGYLAEILDRSTQDFISEMAINTFGDKQWWIGGYEDGDPRSWYWEDNTRILTFQWASGEPNNIDNQEDCIELSNSTDLKWNDENCISLRPSLCQFGLPKCGDPGEPLHGSRSPSDTTSFLDGATVDYECDPGYEVKGDILATCMLNGRWDSERPVCEAVTCPNSTIEVQNAANVTVSSYAYRGVAVYTCSTGYVPDASPVSYCQVDGTWSSPNFTCTLVMAVPTKTTTDALATSLKTDEASPTFGDYTTSPSNDMTSQISDSTTVSSTMEAVTTYTSEDYPASSPKTDKISSTPESSTAPTEKGEITTEPSNEDPQPNIGAIVGGVSAAVIAIILLILAVALTKKRKSNRAKASGALILSGEPDMKAEKNTYYMSELESPGIVEEVDYAGIREDATGSGQINGHYVSHEQPGSASSGSIPNYAQVKKTEMVENELYGQNWR
ncbi:sushi, von Willebrand factor type A, EGF and pentraxin domain-containing protein 1-like isoform X2 [Lytechinus variegatus]|uniref:sushi, von Willebrand factor type A, EGF and pentraxin domain-containing protein 1-like isoform X2 n=1 Tax=Lytechinus variegatus TaxID=7654 RepID=UPI001BB1A225|nr:sushi, von Willebrand factor type A, EGF and pentraxin domain-containing protein 1-like isoform X2 [Lytechinus variegatus]